MIKAWFDGACEPVNPGGTCAYGWHIRDGEHNTIYGNPYKPKDESIQTTNNLAEYAGLYSVLLELKKRSWCDRPIQVYGDSQLVIKQMQGEWRIDPQKPYGYLAVPTAELIQEFDDIQFKWIPREDNHVADKQAESALLKLGIERKIWKKNK